MSTWQGASCVYCLIDMEDERIRAFLRHDYARVVAAVSLLLEDRARAEDAVQEAMVRYWERSAGVESPRAWITTVALNLARTSRRRTQAERRALQRVLRRRPPEGAGQDADDDIRSAVARLPPAQRSAVALHYLVDLSVADVAEVLGVAEGTVKTNLHRARIALRSRLLTEELGDAHR